MADTVREESGSQRLVETFTLPHGAEDRLLCLKGISLTRDMSTFYYARHPVLSRGRNLGKFGCRGLSGKRSRALRERGPGSPHDKALPSEGACLKAFRKHFPNCLTDNRARV